MSNLLVEVIAAQTSRKKVVVPESVKTNFLKVALEASYLGFQQREVISRFFAASKLNFQRGRRLPSMSLNSSD